MDGVQKTGGKEFHFLPKPHPHDLRRLPGIVRSRISGAQERAAPGGERHAYWIQAAVNSAMSIEKSRGRSKRFDTTRGPGSPEQLRRARGVIPRKRSETPPMKSNGHDTSTSKVNGHGPVSPSRAAQEMEAPIEKGRAASDDARDFPSAAAASSAVAGMERDACAEVALPPEGGTPRRPRKGNTGSGTGTPRALSEKNGNNNTRTTGEDKAEKDTVEIPPGSEPLPADGVGFVDAMHAHVDIYLACARLVKSKDPKISQRMVERLLEMSYGKTPAQPEDQAPQIIFDAPRPARD
jgi:hypothetical protein